jgi:hypothetical protein
MASFSPRFRFRLCSFGVTAQLLQDDHRLPEGMKRIGYDADTSQYAFRDRDGSLWQGPEGSGDDQRFGASLS